MQINSDRQSVSTKRSRSFARPVSFFGVGLLLLAACGALFLYGRAKSGQTSNVGLGLLAARR